MAVKRRGGLGKGLDSLIRNKPTASRGEETTASSEKAKITGKEDVYRKALMYTLGICETTREHFTDIFDIKEGLINRNSLQAAYQTSTSMKVTRLSFSLWNSNNYDSDEDLENGIVSTHYNPSDIFCCSYAPYFYEAIKIRYPEYCREGD